MSAEQPALVRQSTEDLEEEYQLKLAEAAEIKAKIDATAKTGVKRKSPEPEETPAQAEEKAEEPAAKKRKVEADEYEDNSTDDDAMSEDEGEALFAEGTSVAVAYGNLDGQSKRKWYAAKVIEYNEEDDTYTVQWKKGAVPRKGSKKKVFRADAWRVKEIPEDDFKTAPTRGTRFVGLHRASTFVAPSKEVATDEESEEETEGVSVGDFVAVAYGNPRANKAGTDAFATNTKKYKKRFLWYAATVQAVSDGEVEVEWKYPTSMKAATFVVPEDKVQPITAKEWKKAKKIARGKPSYGLVGIHRVETRANLTSG